MVSFTSLLLTDLGQRVLAHRVFSDSDSSDIGHTSPMTRVIFTTDSGLISKPIFDIFPNPDSRYDDVNLELKCTARLSNFEHFTSSGLSSQILSDQRVTGIAFATETDSIIATIQPTGTSFFDWDYDANSTCMTQKQISMSLTVRCPESGEVGYDSLSMCSVTTDGLKNFMRRISEDTSVDEDWRWEYYRTGPYTLINIGIGDDQPSIGDTTLEKEFYRKHELYAGSPTRSKIAKAVAKFAQSDFPVYTDTNGVKTDMGRFLYLGEFGLINRDTITESKKLMYQGKIVTDEVRTLDSSHFLTVPLSNTPVLFVIAVESYHDSRKEYYTEGSWFQPHEGDVYCASTVTSLTDQKLVKVDYIHESGSILDYLGATDKFILDYDNEIQNLAFLQQSSCTTQTGYNSPRTKDGLRIIEIIGNTENYLNIQSGYWGFIRVENPEVEGRSNEGMSTEAIDGYGANPSLNDLFANKFGMFAGHMLYTMNEIDDSNTRIGLGYQKTQSGRKMDFPWYSYIPIVGQGLAIARASEYYTTKDNKAVQKEFTNPVYKNHNLGTQVYYVFNFELPEHIKEDEIEHLSVKWSGSGSSGGEFALDWYIWHKGETDGPPEIARGHWEKLDSLSYNAEDSAKVVRTQLLEKPTVQVQGYENLKYYVNGTGFVTLLAITPNVITKEESAVINIDYVGCGIYEKGMSKPQELHKFREGIDYYYDWYRATGEDKTFITWPGCRIGSELSTTVNDLFGETRTIRQNYPVRITNKFQEILNQNTPGIGEQTEFLIAYNWTYAGFDVDNMYVVLDQKEANYGTPPHTGVDAKTTLKRAKTFDVSSNELGESYTQEYYQVGGKRKDNTDLYQFDGNEDVSFENRTIYIGEFRDNIKRNPIEVSYAITYEYLRLYGDVVGGDCVIEDGRFADLAKGGAGTGTLRITDGGTIIFESEHNNVAISLFDTYGTKIWESDFLADDATFESRLYSIYPVALGLDAPSYFKMEDDAAAVEATLSVVTSSPYKGVDPYTNVKVEAILNLPSYYKIVYIRNDGEQFCRSVLKDGSNKPRIKPTEKDSVSIVQEVLVT